MAGEDDQFERWQKLKESHGSEGPLKAYNGAVPPPPDCFKRALSQEPTSHHIEVESCPIHYLQWGDRSKPGLFLVHGNGAHARWWSFIAPYLAADYNVAAMDLSGMGDSGHREVYSMEMFTQEQLAVCEDAGLFDHTEPPIILGHSFGGFVSILTAAEHGERFSGLVIVDSPVNPPERQHGPPERKARPHRRYSTLEDALGRFRLMPPQDCENHYIVDYIARHSLREVAGGWIWKFDPKIWTRFSIGNISERLKQIPCRIGIMRGENSFLFPHEVGEYMYNLLGRQVPVIEIPEAHHHVMLDQPLAFVASVRALLEDWNHSHPSRSMP